jgi:hypothetical protein
MLYSRFAKMMCAVAWHGLQLQERVEKKHQTANAAAA